MCGWRGKVVMRERDLKLPFLFPQHQLCGFYEKQMFTTWYSASSLFHSLSLVPAQPTHTHTHTRVHTQTRRERLTVLHRVCLPASCGLFTVHFPLSPSCVSRFCVNTWYNLVLVPLLSFCASVFSHNILVVQSSFLKSAGHWNVFFLFAGWWRCCMFISKKIVKLHSKF